MEMKLQVLGSIVPLALLTYVWAMNATPRRGLLGVMEKLAVGLCVLYLCNLGLSLFSQSISGNPFSLAATGLLGVPGAVLAFVVQRIL